MDEQYASKWSRWLKKNQKKFQKINFEEKRNVSETKKKITGL